VSSLFSGLGAPGVVSATLLRNTARSSLADGKATTAASSTLADLSVLAGAVTAKALSTVSTSSADAYTAGSDAIGSTITDLRVNNVPASTVPGTTVSVKDVTGTITIAKLEVLPSSVPAATLSGGMWSTSHSTDALRITVLQSTGLLGPAPGTVIRVAHAESKATYPSGLVCGSSPANVSGEAFIASARGTIGTVDVATARQGDAVLPAYGGSASNSVANVLVPSVLSTGIGNVTTSGATGSSPHSTSNGHVANVSLLGGAVTASALDVTSTSSANGTSAATSFVTTFTNLVVGGTPISLPVTPGTVIAVPQPSGDVLYVVLDERETASAGGTDTQGTVVAIHGYVLSGQVITAEVVVASAHSDAHTAR
jgi:hypothetical protein